MRYYISNHTLNKKKMHVDVRNITQTRREGTQGLVDQSFTLSVKPARTPSASFLESLQMSTELWLNAASVYLDLPTPGVACGIRILPSIRSLAPKSSVVRDWLLGYNKICSGKCYWELLRSKHIVSKCWIRKKLSASS